MNDDALRRAQRLLRTRPGLVLGGLAFACAVSVLQFSYRSYAEASARTETEGRELSVRLVQLHGERHEWEELLESDVVARMIETAHALVPESEDIRNFLGTIRGLAQKFDVEPLDIAIEPALSDEEFKKTPVNIVLRGQAIDVCRVVQDMSEIGRLVEVSTVDLRIANGTLADANVRVLLYSDPKGDRANVKRDERDG